MIKKTDNGQESRMKRFNQEDHPCIKYGARIFTEKLWQLKVLVSFFKTLDIFYSDLRILIYLALFLSAAYTSNSLGFLELIRNQENQIVGQIDIDSKTKGNFTHKELDAVRNLARKQVLNPKCASYDHQIQTRICSCL